MPPSATPVPGMPEPEKSAPEKPAAAEQRVTAVSCGPFANASEKKALDRLKTGLLSAADGGKWVLLTNLSFSAGDKFQADEIDIAAIGPPGARVIEVKHWTAKWMAENKDSVEHEADKITRKAKKIAGKLRGVVPGLPRVDGVLLLTEEPAKVREASGKEYSGVGVHGLAEWKAAVNFEASAKLSEEQIKRLARALEPRSGVALDGSLRRLGGCIGLKLQTPGENLFHRIYKGTHADRQERVWLHLYDLSAGGKDADAGREY